MSIADTITPPRAGRVGAVSVSTTATSAVDLGSVGGLRYFTFIADVEWGFIFSDKNDTTNLPAPDFATTGQDITGGTIDGRCPRFAAGQPVPVTVGGSDRYFRAIAAASGTLRYWQSSPTS